MRIDKYLKVSRIIKRRTMACEACDAGRVSVNGKMAKPSTDVKVGDELEIRFGSGTTKVRIISVNEKARKEEAAGLYELIC